HLQKGHAVVFADVDGDGDQDVFAQMGGAFGGDAFHDALYENPGTGRHWLDVRLIGETSNRSAIGALLRVTITVDGASRTLHRRVGSGGSFGANPLRQHFGLGSADRVDRLEVTWPVTGETRTFEGLEVDRVVTIREGEGRE
ncbi:MAG: ASPIC/UnbV domain-containing protein, partial [Planctomycetota bacterium JB042]